MSNKDKSSFVMRADWYDLMEPFDDDKIGEIMRIIFRFEKGETVCLDNLDPALKGIAQYILGQLKLSDKKYQEKVEKCRAAARASADARQQTLTDANERERTSTDAQRTSTDVNGRQPTETETETETDSLPDGREKPRARERGVPASKKLSYGVEFGHVKLTEEEHSKLLARYPTVAEELINEMDLYLDNHPGKYKKHYSALLNWARRRVNDEGGGKGGETDNRAAQGKVRPYEEVKPDPDSASWLE